MRPEMGCLAAAAERATVCAVRPIMTLLLASLGACGHPASREECEEIFRRSAEIELRARDVTDADEIARRTEEARAARGDRLVEGCVGKRVTYKAMDCVRSANTSEELDKCLE